MFLLSKLLAHLIRVGSLAVTDAAGSARLRGFKGRYRVAAGAATGEFDLTRPGQVWTLQVG